MKHEMTLAEQKRRGVGGIDAQLDAMDVSDTDRAEVRKFASLLKDSNTMRLSELVEKHGAAYLGFTPNEVAEISKET